MVDRGAVVAALAAAAGLPVLELESRIREHDRQFPVNFDDMLAGMASYSLDEILEVLVCGRFGQRYL